MARSNSADSGAKGVAILRSIDEVNENQWNNLVTHADQGTLFHRHEWLAAIENGLDYEPRHVVVRKDTNPVAIMPNFVSALAVPNDVANLLASSLEISVMKSGGIGYGGPIITNNERENIDLLFDALEATTEPQILYHLISTADLGQIRYGQYLRSRGYEPKSNVATFFIDLSAGWEDILAGMDKSRRKDIRRSHEQDYHVEITPIGSDMCRTYDMYEKNTRRVGGNLIPFSFFETLRDYVPDRVRVFTATVDGEIVGRYVYLLDTEKSILHHWFSAIPERECYDHYPSELMHTRAIKWGIEQGFKEYSFGAAGSHFDNSVFRFKTQYGAKAVPVLRWERGTNPLVWPLFKFGRQRFVAKEL
ncbi:GNAT family N-acetyltransferase [Haladaptatus sp. GCM10025707]|uniref:GNAT family N-acetyltransferase n=1 Tax=unclassified Haladaptatus TaxID=2622732 RepID=UPI0023E75B1D|nr:MULTISPECIES: GNAT family N-acetyltransferase [unclassified Haladaptatus]